MMRGLASLTPYMSSCGVYYPATVPQVAAKDPSLNISKVVMEASDSRPEKLTGGCLCGAIRYTITISPDMEWPPTRNGSCQCTLCRKFTGSLVHQSGTFPSSSISPPFTSNASYTQFASSQKASRGFCRVCGSSLTFRFAEGDQIEILFGTIDEEILRSKVGTELCLSKSHIWCENAVKGVTDNMPGVLWSQEYDSEKLGRS